MSLQAKKDLINLLERVVKEPSLQSSVLLDAMSELQRQKDSLGTFVVSTLTVNDCFEAGLVVPVGADLDRLAGKMSDDYCEQLYWEHLPTLAEYMGFKTLENVQEIMLSILDYPCMEPMRDRHCLYNLEEAVCRMDWVAKLLVALSSMEAYTSELPESENENLEIINQLKQLILWKSTNS